MDYDRTDIAAIYDKGRVLTPEAQRQTHQLLTAYIDPQAVSLVVDVGCGTGRFCQLLADHFGASIIGVEPSQTMLDQARRKPPSARIMLLRAPAEASPLDDGCVDLIFMSNVYHHLADPHRVARECRRMLRPGGHICLRNGTHESDFPQRLFFPALRPLIDAELPRRQDITANFVAVGLGLVGHEVVIQVVAPDWPSFVEKSATRADSFLARISDRDFDRGMAAMRARSAAADADRPVTEEIDWFVFTKGNA
jgi:SAM-dependent methyltransferase